MFARTCVFSKQSLPTGLCGHHTLSQASWYKRMAPLLPKLRGHFAEFLHHDSLDLLSILYLTTCVGFGYGQLRPRVDAFLGSIGSLTSPYGSPSPLTLHAPEYYSETGYRLSPGQPSPGTSYLPASHLLTRSPHQFGFVPSPTNTPEGVKTRSDT